MMENEVCVLIALGPERYVSITGALPDAEYVARILQENSEPISNMAGADEGLFKTRIYPPTSEDAQAVYADSPIPATDFSSAKLTDKLQAAVLEAVYTDVEEGSIGSLIDAKINTILHRNGLLK